MTEVGRNVVAFKRKGQTAWDWLMSADWALSCLWRMETPLRGAVFALATLTMWHREDPEHEAALLSPLPAGLVGKEPPLNGEGLRQIAEVPRLDEDVRDNEESVGYIAAELARSLSVVWDAAVSSK